MVSTLLLAGGVLFVIELFTEDTYSSADALVEDLGPLGLEDCGPFDRRTSSEARLVYRVMAIDIGGPGAQQISCRVEEDSTGFILAFVWPNGSELSSEALRAYKDENADLITLGAVALGTNWMVLGDSAEDAQDVVELIGGEVVRARAD